MPARALYDELIMDHIRNARNYRALDTDRSATGRNPLCGDDVTVYLELGFDKLEDVSFQCTACGIAMASASIMTESVKGMAVSDARALIRSFVCALNGHAAPPDRAPAQRAILATVEAFPARTRCAVLPWVTLEAVLDGREDVVFIR